MILKNDKIIVGNGQQVEGNGGSLRSSVSSGGYFALEGYDGVDDLQEVYLII